MTSYGYKQTYKAGNILQRLAPSCVFLFSALGLLPALLFDTDPNAVLCKTPVGDDPKEGLLLSHPPLIRLSTEDFLHSAALILVWCKTSPRGPPSEGSQVIGIQFACSVCCSILLLIPKPIGTESSSWDILRGERVSFSLLVQEVDGMKAEEAALGIEIDNRVLSDCILSCSGQETTAGRSAGFLGQSSMKWRRGCWESVSRTVRFCEEPPKFPQLITEFEDLFCEGLRRASEVTSPNSDLEDSSYPSCCFWIKNAFSLDNMERSGVCCILSPALSLFMNILQWEIKMYAKKNSQYHESEPTLQYENSIRTTNALNIFQSDVEWSKLS